METNEVWLRVGVTITAEPDVVDKIRLGDEKTLVAALRGEIGNARFDGDTYIPEGFVGETHHDEVVFNLDPMPIPPTITDEREIRLKKQGHER